jgi:hypothetical protein
MNWLLVILQFLVRSWVRESDRLQPVLARSDGRTTSCRLDTNASRDVIARGKQLVIAMLEGSSWYEFGVSDSFQANGGKVRHPNACLSVRADKSRAGVRR